MRDAMLWSFPLGRLFGIAIKVHWLFFMVAAGVILRPIMSKPPLPPPDGACFDAFLIVLFLFISTLLHEFGHCFAARWVNGDAHEILMWPLGGLAMVDLPHKPHAHLITSAAGPAVNLVLALITVLCLWFIPEQPLQPAWSLLGYPGRATATDFPMYNWSNELQLVGPLSVPALLTRFFWVNWIGFLLNVILLGYPLDGGRMFQAIVWIYSDYRTGTLWAVYSGYICAMIVAIWSISTGEPLPCLLAVFILQACLHQHTILESGGDESLFGYDFSQGYTSLERDHPEPLHVPRRQSWWQRWLQKRTARRIQREQETREADERRMDALLEKLHSQGRTAMTEEELRFMKMFSDRYRNRNNS